jgi:hypothetical protein
LTLRSGAGMLAVGCWSSAVWAGMVAGGLLGGLSCCLCWFVGGLVGCCVAIERMCFV